jgi:hypothetical protein
MAYNAGQFAGARHHFIALRCSFTASLPLPGAARATT